MVPSSFSFSRLFLFPVSPSVLAEFVTTKKTRKEWTCRAMGAFILGLLLRREDKSRPSHWQKREWARMSHFVARGSLLTHFGREIPKPSLVMIMDSKRKARQLFSREAKCRFAGSEGGELSTIMEQKKQNYLSACAMRLSCLHISDDTWKSDVP